MKCSLANGGFVVSSYENNRHGCVRYLETVSKVDTRHITEVDIENDASRIAEIVVVGEGLCRRKQQAIVAELPQQTRYTSQHRGVVIDDEHNIIIWQTGFLGQSASAA